MAICFAVFTFYALKDYTYAIAHSCGLNDTQTGWSLLGLFGVFILWRLRVAARERLEDAQKIAAADELGHA